MASIPKFFSTNLDIIFFVYGMSFALLGATFLIQRKKDSRFKLAETLWLLGFFGIVHGLNEFLQMWKLIRYAEPRRFLQFDLLFITLSFAFLFEYGRRSFSISNTSITPLCPAKKNHGYALPVLLTLIAVISGLSPEPLSTAKILSRYLLGFPGAVLAGAALLCFYRSEKESLRPLKVRGYLITAGVAFVVYGAFSGLIVDKGGFFPANILNTESFFLLTGMPVQLFRAACALSITWGILGSLKIFHGETEKALRDAIHELHYVVDFLPDPTFVLDPEGKVVAWNKAMEKISGVPKQEMLGKGNYEYSLHFYGTRRPVMLDLLNTDIREIKKTYPNIFKKQGEILSSELFLPKLNNGAGAHIWATAAPLLDLDGKYCGGIESFRDISERVHAEAARQESEARYRTFIDAGTDIIYLKDAAFRYLISNNANNIFLNRSGDVVIGSTDFDLMPEETAKQCRVSDQSVLSRMLPVTAEETVGEKTYQSLKFPVPLSGGLVGVGAYIRDITESKTADAERERLRLAVEQAGEGIIITDDKGVIQYVNPAFENISGYVRSEVLGKTPRILKSGKQAGLFYKNMWAEISAGRNWQGRMVNKRKDGTLYTVQAVISSIKDPAGKIVNYVSVKSDISAELELESQFLQSQKMEAVGALAGGVAHDFNNILTAIISYAGFIRKGLAPEDPMRADAQEILNASDRAVSLTRQLLAFSRRQILDARVRDLNVILGDMTKMLKRLIGENIVLATKIAPLPCFAKVDAGQFEQVIMNLVVNARDAMPEGGQITLETEILAGTEVLLAAHPDLPRGSLVRLTVSDTGTGMTEAVKKHIFEPFYTTKAQGKGTGLGLSTVFGIVKQSGGVVDVQSEPGKGTIFFIYLPHIENAVADKEKDTDKDKDSAVHGTETVLVVDDDEVLRRLNERILKMTGYNVLVAGTGAEALTVLERHGKPVDLLLTDVVMTGMSGRELALEIGRRKMSGRTLYMSGYTDDAIVRHGVLDQDIAFIYKPFTAEALCAKLREVLEGPADKAKA